MTRTAGPILVVEVDRQRGDTLCEQLIADGYSVELARSVEHARILAGQRDPVLALLGDLDSHRGTLVLLEEIRRDRWKLPGGEGVLPVLMIGSVAGELGVLRAFETGADDVLHSRSGYLEIRARVRALLRRVNAQPEQPRTLEVGPLTIDTTAHSVLLDGRVLELRRLEYELLLQLAVEPTRVFTREELLRAVWGYRFGAKTRTLDSHASRLRRKLSAGTDVRWIVNVRGVGYRLM